MNWKCCWWDKLIFSDKEFLTKSFNQKHCWIFLLQVTIFLILLFSLYHITASTIMAPFTFILILILFLFSVPVACISFRKCYKIKIPIVWYFAILIISVYSIILLFLFYSIQGLMAHKFTEPGTYYFSDQNHEFSATFMGTIIVKSKPKEHFLEVNAQTGFSNGNPQKLIHMKKNPIYFVILSLCWKKKNDYL